LDDEADDVPVGIAVVVSEVVVHDVDVAIVAVVGVPLNMISAVAEAGGVVAHDVLLLHAHPMRSACYPGVEGEGYLAS